MAESPEVKNYVITIVGRGVSYAYLMKGALIDVTHRCTPAVKSGFEVYIYELTPSPAGSAGFCPEGATTLKRVFHLFDAKDEFIDEVKSIINRLDCHSEEASLEYLNLMITVLDNERGKLQSHVNNK